MEVRVEQTEHRGILEQWKDSVLYHDGRYMSLYIYPNPQNVQHQEGILAKLWTGWPWCVNLGLSIATYVPLWWEITIKSGNKKSLYLPLNFALNRKLPLTNIALKKNNQMNKNTHCGMMFPEHGNGFKIHLNMAMISPANRLGFLTSKVWQDN